MSVLGELDLLGPRAHGAACGEAVLKAVAEDFQVDEVLDIPLSGEGEHLWLWVEKRGLNTEEAARRLGRAAHAAPQPADEPQVQGNVQPGGQRQKQQRHHRVAQRPQQRGKVVVQENRRQPGKHDL